MQKNVACWVFCVLFSAINSKWGVICQFNLRAPLWLVQLQYMVPVTLKVGQKYALDDFATDTCTHRTKSWPPGFYKDDLCAKTVYFMGFNPSAIKIAENNKQNTQQATVFCIISSH